MTLVAFDTPVVETERLRLRAPRFEDFEPLRAFMASDRSRFVRGEAPLDDLGTWRALAHVTGMWALRGYGLFVLTDRATGAALGMAGAWHPVTWPEREIGWSIWSPEAEGTGLAHEAARAARDFAYGTLGWSTAVSYIHPDNARSIALARRLGCTLDAGAEGPVSDQPCQVWRHPAPEGRA